MASTIQFNEEIYRGDTYSVSFIWDDDAGDPIDISDWLIFYMIKENSGLLDAAALVSYNSTDDTTAIIKSDSGSGTTDKFTLKILSTDSISLDEGEYVHEIQRVNSGDVWTLARGRLTVIADVVRKVTA